MGEPWGVIVVPASGDPGGLLAVGRCGALPPTVYQSFHPPTWKIGHPGPLLGALPLWWDGALVPEGWDRARRVLASWLESSHNTIPALAAVCRAMGMNTPDRTLTLILAVGLWRAGPADRIVILGRSEDGRLVERVSP